MTTTIACHFANAVEERGHVDVLMNRGISMHRRCLVERFAEVVRAPHLQDREPCACWCHQEGGVAVNHLTGARERKGL